MLSAGVLVTMLAGLGLDYEKVAEDRGLKTMAAPPRRMARQPGSKLCGCGRRISANKNSCMRCASAEEENGR